MGDTNVAQSQTSQAGQKAIVQGAPAVDEALHVQTPGGFFKVQCSRDGKAIAMG
jgi:hypothetical protein